MGQKHSWIVEYLLEYLRGVRRDFRGVLIGSSLKWFPLHSNTVVELEATNLIGSSGQDINVNKQINKQIKDNCLGRWLQDYSDFAHARYGTMLR